MTSSYLASSGNRHYFFIELQDVTDRVVRFRDFGVSNPTISAFAVLFMFGILLSKSQP
jgi:hypothetical protein